MAGERGFFVVGEAPVSIPEQPQKVYSDKTFYYLDKNHHVVPPYQDDNRFLFHDVPKDKTIFQKAIPKTSEVIVYRVENDAIKMAFEKDEKLDDKKNESASQHPVFAIILDPMAVPAITHETDDLLSKTIALKSGSIKNDIPFVVKPDSIFSFRHAIMPRKSKINYKPEDSLFYVVSQGQVAIEEVYCDASQFKVDLNNLHYSVLTHSGSTFPISLNGVCYVTVAQAALQNAIPAVAKVVVYKNLQDAEDVALKADADASSDKKKSESVALNTSLVKKKLLYHHVVFGVTVDPEAVSTEGNYSSLRSQSIFNYRCARVPALSRKGVALSALPFSDKNPVGDVDFKSLNQASSKDKYCVLKHDRRDSYLATLNKDGIRGVFSRYKMGKWRWHQKEVLAMERELVDIDDPGKKFTIFRNYLNKASEKELNGGYGVMLRVLADNFRPGKS